MKQTLPVAEIFCFFNNMADVACIVTTCKMTQDDDVKKYLTNFCYAHFSVLLLFVAFDILFLGFFSSILPKGKRINSSICIYILYLKFIGAIPIKILS